MQIDEYGIRDEYHDAFGTLHHTSRETRDAILAAMGLEPGQAVPRTEVRVVHPGRALPIPGRGELHLEEGGTFKVDGALPPDLPLGYHELRLEGEEQGTLLIAAPEACPLPADLRGWGWAVQLYAARSRRSWGIGDFSDLRAIAGWARGLGAELLLLNPLCAVPPTRGQVASPYSPGSRRFLNPLYLAVEEIPGAAAALGDELDAIVARGRALNAGERIERDAAFALKLSALERIFALQAEAPPFARYREERGPSLEEFATYCAIAEREGGDYRRWPSELSRPDTSATRRFATEHAGRVAFHAWLQWQLDEQLESASSVLRVIHDLPIGVDPGGADAWAWQDTLARGVGVGAPPDPFNAEGQDWGIPPFIPARLRAAAYRPLRETLRASLREGGGLRIDHVMGLFRLFWIPIGRRAVEGAYVYYPAEELIAIVALESARAGAVVIGEDLGTVEPGVRERLAQARILSYRLAYFQDCPPADYPELALAAVTTHDLPTVAGLWTGDDLVAQRAVGLTVREDDVARMRQRIRALAGVGEHAGLEELVVELHRALAAAPSLILNATLDDALLARERPNLPGTCFERPNWSLPLPRPLEELFEAELPRRIAEALRR
jgi:4-alpha-glucanotransferase